MGHCQFFGTLDVLCRYMGVVHVVLSEIALFTKLEQDERTKQRLIGRFSLTERIVLSRLEGAVEDGKHFFRIHSALEWLVLGWAHAFHKVHVRNGPYSSHFVLKVLGMGEKSSPNIFVQLAAAIGRVVSSTTSVARCTWMTLKQGHALAQSRCWPSPSRLRGARECSMVSTIVNPLSG